MKLTHVKSGKLNTMSMRMTQKCEAHSKSQQAYLPISGEHPN